MLTQISVKNLGCFDDKPHTIDFTEETLIAGPNNSGKSMILASMNLVRYWLVTGGRLAWDTEFFKLHGFMDAVNAHDQRKSIDVSFTMKEKDTEYVFHTSIQSDTAVSTSLISRPPHGPQSKRTVHPGDTSVVELIHKIWCIHPHRSPVPFQADVRHTAGPLQPLRSNGSNVINYLLERWTGRDKRWEIAESWLRKIDADMSELKTPIRGNRVFLETLSNETDVNLSLQGSGFQSAAAIIAALVFSPEGSTIIIEEPEVFLHPKSQEVIVDLINDTVNNQNKQVIFSTHSCNILLPIWHDVGQPSHRRDEEHIRLDPKKFSMWVFEKASGKMSIKLYPIHEKTWKNFSNDFKIIWG